MKCGGMGVWGLWLLPYAQPPTLASEAHMTANGKRPHDAVILAGSRTPIGKFMGALAPVPAPRLGAAAVRAAVERAGVDPAQIEEVILGQVIAAGSGQSPARQAGIFSGLPAEVGAYLMVSVWVVVLPAESVAVTVTGFDPDFKATVALQVPSAATVV